MADTESTMINIILFGIINALVCSLGKYFIQLLPVVTKYLFNARVYNITQEDTIAIVCRKVKDKSSELKDCKYAHGYFIGKWYIGYITTDNKNSNKGMIQIFCTKKTYDKLVINKHVKTTVDNNDKFKVTIMQNKTNCYYPKYIERSILVKKIPKKSQEICIESIIEKYNSSEEKHITCFLTGDVGTGKSMTCIFLAQKMNAKYCKDFNPLRPGSSLHFIYADSNPTEKHPLIIVLEEVDILLKKIHDSTTKMSFHEQFVSEITDKTSWNNMLDDLDIGLYNNIIFIMTSNKTIEQISEMDPSYLRPGRVHFSYHMKNENTDLISDFQKL